MAQPGGFVPAWKRLGLKLKKFDEAEPNLQASEQQHQQQQQLQHGQTSVREGSPSQQDVAAGHTPESKSRLGKRKHHSDTPDIQGGDSVKKSKRDRNNGHADGDAVAAPVVESEAVNTGESEALPADTAPLKGDPNYRRKKGGDSNYRKKKEPKEPKSGQKSSQTHAQHLSAPTPLRTPSLSPGQTDLLPSTEVDHLAPAILATPQRQLGHLSKHNTSSLSPSKTDRRKSVTFTPDTKTSDGNSASNLFKKWVAEQKGSAADFTPAEVAQFTEPPKVHVANGNTSTSQTPKRTLLPTVAPKGKKDPSRYLNYLAQYYQDRENWKFNKATQNDVLGNALNIFRIPEEYTDALVEYVGGLQGAGIIERLREQWSKAIAEIDEAERKDPMDEREAMKEAALQERLSKERKRRRLEGDIENMIDHPYSEGYIRRLKRSRAEALCAALKIPVPVATTPQHGLRQMGQQQSSESTRPVAQSTTRKKKRRTDISSDESSDSSSSEEESSSDESSEDEESSASSSGGEEEKNSDTQSDSDSSDESGDSSASEDDSD